MVVVSTEMNGIGGIVQAVVAPCLRYIAHVAAGTAVVVAAGTAVVVAASTAVPVAGGGDTSNNCFLPFKGQEPIKAVRFLKEIKKSQNESNFNITPAC